MKILKLIDEDGIASYIYASNIVKFEAFEKAATRIFIKDAPDGIDVFELMGNAEDIINKIHAAENGAKAVDFMEIKLLNSPTASNQFNDDDKLFGKLIN